MTTWREAEQKLKERYPAPAVVVRLFDKIETNQFETRPADFIITDQGRTWYNEVKKCDNPTAFPFSYLKRTQRAYANQILAAGGEYRVSVYHAGQWYDIPYQVIQQATKKSLTWGELEIYRDQRKHR